MTLTIGGACSGVGMLERAVQATFGGEVVWHSEIDTHASKVLAARSDAPNLGDLTQVDWSEVERPDVFCAGFPCTDLSVAGKRAGLNGGTRSGVWWMIADAIGVMRPPVVVLENVSAIVNGRDLDEETDDDGGDPRWRGVVADSDRAAGRTWLGAVLGSLAELGYVGRYGVVRAADAGAPHLRTRWFCVATEQVHRRPAPLGALVAAESLTGALLPTPTAMQPGGTAEMFVARKAAAGISPTISDLRMLLDVIVATDGWAPYEKALLRWANQIGRPHPAPHVGVALNPSFAEWMMGWPEGWCTDVAKVSQNQAVKMCGNGVVPQQAELALRLLCR